MTYLQPNAAVLGKATDSGSPNDDPSAHRAGLIGQALLIVNL